jgi:hypothetical protein
MLNKIVVCILFQVAALAPAIGQKHDFNWILGAPNNAGDILNFMNNELDISVIEKSIPLNITNTTMSSFSGDFVFLFNGLNLQDRGLDTMQNSDSLAHGLLIGLQYYKTGAPFTQGSLALPSQKDTNQFLLFYWDFEEYIYTPDSPYVAPYHLYMAKIDQSGNNGLGGVIEKNIIVISDTLANAGIVATKHANGRDWWVVVPEIVSNRYHTLLISNDSIVQSFSQSIGVVWPPFIDISSQSVFLSNGSKYLRFSDEVGLQIFDFDRCSGLFSNPELINFDFDGGYFGGLSASRDSRFVYVSDRLNLYQYDLQSTDIEGTKTFIATYDGFMNPGRCLFSNPQLAPDGRIYLNNNFYQGGVCRNLHVINHPERQGQDCDFVQHGINLNNLTVGGLPNNPNYRLGPIDGSPCDTLGIDNIPLAAFRYDRDSSNALRIEFTELADYEPETWYWEFGDGDTSWQRYPVHEYDTAGTYQACLTVSNQSGSDTYCKTVPLGVSQVDSPGREAAFVITPNPNRGAFLIHADNLTGARMIVYDVLGNVVAEQRIIAETNEFRLLHDLPAGTYFCRIIGTDGQTRTTSFIVTR